MLETDKRKCAKTKVIKGWSYCIQDKVRHPGQPELRAGHNTSRGQTREHPEQGRGMGHHQPEAGLHPVSSWSKGRDSIMIFTYSTVIFMFYHPLHCDPPEDKSPVFLIF